MWRGPFATLECDWVPKTEILFTSPDPFTWTQTSEAKKAEITFRTPWNPEADAALLLSPGERFFALLRHWVFPGTLSVPSSMARLAPGSTPAAKEDKDDLAYHQQLTKDWNAALNSLQASFFGHPDQYFYVFGTRFTVLFRHYADRGPVALITRSTKGLRGVLKDHGIDFQMPLYDVAGGDLPGDERDAAAEDDDERKETLEDLQFFTALNPRKT